MSKNLDTSSEEFRALCEARTVMRMPRAERQAYYKQVLNARGQEAMQKLVQDVNAEWARTHAERSSITMNHP